MSLVTGSRAVPRVAFIAGSFHPARCGVANYTLRLTTELTRYGVEPVLLTTEQAARRERAAVPVVGAVQGWSLPRLASLAQHLRTQGAELLHLQFAPASYDYCRDVRWLPALLVLRGWRRPVVVTLHEYAGDPFERRGLAEQVRWLGEQRGWWDRETGLLACWSDAIVVTNRHHRAELAQRIPGTGHKAHEIPIGPNIVASGPPSLQQTSELRRRFDLPEESPLIAFFGFVHPVKGVEYLLQALAQVVVKHPYVRLLLIGGFECLALRGAEASSYRQRVLGLIGSLGLESHVRVTDYVSEETASHLLTCSEVSVLPLCHGVTMKSSSLLALLAHGLPLVATKAEPPAPWLRHGQNALLVPPRDPHALAEALTRLLEDPALRSRLRRGAREVAQHFSWPTIAAAHVQLYERLLHPCG